MRRRVRTIISALAMMAQLLSTAVVLCQEADGSVQLELRGAGCCEGDAPGARPGDGPSVAGHDGDGQPCCACAEDRSLDPASRRDTAEHPVAVARLPESVATCDPAAPRPSIRCTAARGDPPPDTVLIQLGSIVLRN